MADEQAVAKSLAEQLVDQKQQLEDNIRQTESQLSRLKEQYLKVLGALEFAEIQKQQEAPVVTEETDVA
jgi:phage shock protein A|tara:strand:- start:251 stop:457 length:207 start_codon:yes stop_codon:yes gene_type:complete